MSSATHPLALLQPAGQTGAPSQGSVGRFHRLDHPERSVSRGAEHVPLPSARTESLDKDRVVPRSQSATQQNSHLPLSRQGGLMCSGNACLFGESCQKDALV